MNKKFTIINNETGECIDINEKIGRSYKNAKKHIIDKMLKEAKTVEDVDLEMYSSWLKSKKLLNNYNQVKLNGYWISMEFLELGMEEPIMYAYASQLLKLAHTYTNVLMKNHKSWIRTWDELYDELDIKNERTKPKFKKFCTEHSIVRTDKSLKGKDEEKFTTKLILNPFMLRKGSHIAYPAIGRYSDIEKTTNSMDGYVYSYLMLYGIIDNELDDIVLNLSKTVK